MAASQFYPAYQGSINTLTTFCLKKNATLKFNYLGQFNDYENNLIARPGQAGALVAPTVPLSYVIINQLADPENADDMQILQALDVLDIAQTGPPVTTQPALVTPVIAPQSWFSTPITK